MESESAKAEGKNNGNHDNNEEEGPHAGDADEGSSMARLGGESVKQEPDEEQESKDNSG